VRNFRQCAARAFSCLASAALLIGNAAAANAPSPDTLAAAVKDRRVVLLGEVHDNGTQHALRLAAVRLLVESGARPAIAFEQFDRERQADIDRARREQPRDADFLITAAGGAKSWRWEFYRPFVQLALDNDLPIVAANLSRKDAMRLATEGWPAIFEASAQASLALDHLPEAFRRAHEQAVATGHCNLLPPDALPAMARAQIGRDLVLAQSIRPYIGRGVVLLAGNGHVRRDIGVPFWLTTDERKQAISVGLLEVGEALAPAVLTDRFDVVMMTPAAERPDQCEELRKRFAPAKGR